MKLKKRKDMWNKKKDVREALFDQEGGSPTSSGTIKTKLDDQSILDYAKNSLTDWKLNPETSELAQFSLFVLLNDGDSDLMADYDELQQLLKFVQPEENSEGQVVKEPHERLKAAFDKFQKNYFLDFRSFQLFLKEIELEEQVNQIDRILYLQYYRKNPLLLCIGRCCGNRFRKVRMAQTANQLKKMIEIENKRTPTRPMNPFMIIIAMQQVLGGYLQLFDFYSDIIVIYIIYMASIDPANQNTPNDYQLAMTICFMSIVATFMAQQSCIIGMKFAQGDFEPQVFKNSGCISKIVNILLLTFIGSFFLIPIELLENLSKIVKLPGLLLGGVKGVQKVEDCFISIKKSFTRLNSYQLNCLEQQRRVTALLFENLPFTVLVFLIKIHWLKCPELSTGKSSMTINISLASTLLQVMMTVGQTRLESSWLRESTLSYLMTKMTSNNNWIPFIHQITKRECRLNINYGNLTIKTPFVSHVFGFQQLVLYEFSDSTLNYLLNELKLWSSEINGQTMEHKHTLTFTKDCLNEVSLNTLVHFVHNFPTDVFDMDMQLDWYDFYRNKEQQGKIDFIVENGKEQAFSPTGVPLLQLCIQNEKSSQTQPLKDLLQIILDSGKFSIQGSTHESPLVVALQDNCFESLNLMINGDYNIDYQQVDSRGVSFIGQVILKLQSLPGDSGEDFDNLSQFADKLFSNLDLDLHKEQFENTGTAIKSVSAWQLVFKNLRHHRQIRYATQLLLDVIETKGNFQIKDNEKSTLFKNSTKLLMAHGQDAQTAWSKLGELTKKCQVDVFTFRDKNDRGLTHKMVRSWPLHITESSALKRIIQTIETDQMKEQGVNGQTLIYQQILELNLLPDIFKGSIHSSEQILKIDSANRDGKIILDLNTKDLRQLVIKQLAVSKLTLQRNYDSLIKLVKDRFNDPLLDNDVYQEALKYSLALGRSEEEDDADNQDYMFKGLNLTRKSQLSGQDSQVEQTRLTRCKVRTGNLKRNVCNELQGKIQINQLTELQMENLQIKGDTSKQNRRQAIGTAMRTFLETVLEWIAAADLYTDVLVLMQLLNTKHHAWTTLTIFSMVAPFFACQTPFLMFLKEKVYRDVQYRLKLRSMGWIMVAPIMLVYMFILDIIFVINQAILFPIIILLKILTLGFIDLSCLSRALEKTYEFLFEMHKLEVAGFRRMRTISQLTFESLIQFLLQVRMLMYFNQLDNQQAVDEFGVSATAISVSVCLALSHALLESVFLYMEAQASKTSFINYCIICFNGRFGWVPYNDYLVATSQLLADQQKLSSSIKKIAQSTKIELDYEHIHSKICCFDIQVDFMFTDTTIQALSKTLSAFPPISNEKDMPVIKFGSTINLITIDNLVNLLKVCVGRVIIDIHGADLKKIILNSRHRGLIQSTNAALLSADNKEFLFSLQESKLFPLLKEVLMMNEQLLRATKQDSVTGEDINLIWVAYKKQDCQLLDLLLTLESDVLKEQMAEVKDRSCLTLRFIDTMNFDIWQQLAINTTIWDPHQESFYFQAFMQNQTQDPAFFNKSLKWWHSRFGPSMPQEIVSDVKRWSSAYDFMMDSRKLYPERVYVYSGKEMVDVECKTAFCFAAIRKKFVRAWNISSTGPAIDKQLSDGTYNKPMDISDLGVPLHEFKLLNMLLSEEDHLKVKNLDEYQVKSLDEWAVKLKLDISRWLYVGRSRMGDQSGNQIEVIFLGKDIYCKYWGDRSDKPLNKLCNGSNSKINKLPYNQMTFQDSLEVKMPKNMNWITYHESSIKLPKKNTVMSCFVFQQDTNFLGYLFSYGSQKKLKYIADGVKMSQHNEIKRQADIDSSKGYYMLGSLIPGSRCTYCPHPLHHEDTTCESLRITMHIDFPPDADIDKEMEYLENQAQRLKKEYEDQLPVFREQQAREGN